jgi:DNA-binding NarL/FixJ family response regulator
MIIDSAPDPQLIKKNILIVDDHPFIIEGYKNAITRYNPEQYEFLILQAHDCKSGYDLIQDEKTPEFDVAFLDISMPAYEEKDIFSGEDLAKLILHKMPRCKVILLTMYTELLKIKTIIRTIKPNGLVIKNDLTFDELLYAFDKVMKNDKYYSQSVQKILDQSPHNSIEIDEFDKQILFHLSKGTSVEDMPHYIPISLNAIQKRKVSLKELLKVKGSDEELVKEARSKGLF